MNDLLSLLSGGDLRSDGRANEVADKVLEQPELFDDLFAGIWDPDEVIGARTAHANAAPREGPRPGPSRNR